MIKNKETKRCRNCDTVFRPFKTTDKFCSFSCAETFQSSRKSKKNKQIKPISKVSRKRQQMNRQYSVDRKEFLSRPENKFCFIDGCKKRATTIEHTAGRIGKKFLDQTFWKPCCLFHNLELERDPELSKIYQLSKIHNGQKIDKTN